MSGKRGRTRWGYLLRDHSDLRPVELAAWERSVRAEAGMPPKYRDESPEAMERRRHGEAWDRFLALSELHRAGLVEGDFD